MRRRKKVLLLCSCGIRFLVRVDHLIHRKTKLCFKCSRPNLKARPQHGSDNHFWKGGKARSSQGYIYTYFPNHPYAFENGTYVREHRLVMERMLGRYLTKEEVVHHINGDPADNREENLELFSSNSEHNRLCH